MNNENKNPNVEETLESSQTAYNVLLQIYLFVWKTSFEGMKSKTYIRFC